jgi:hypothetical protein
VGTGTLGAMEQCDDRDLLNELAFFATAYYKSLIEKFPANEKYAKGWLARAGKLPE